MSKEPFTMIWATLFPWASFSGGVRSSYSTKKAVSSYVINRRLKFPNIESVDADSYEPKDSKGIIPMNEMSILELNMMTL